jgi:hypothetical protein
LCRKPAYFYGAEFKENNGIEAIGNRKPDLPTFAIRSICRGMIMFAEDQALEKIVTQVKQLSPEYRLRLIQRITDTLIPSFPRQPKPIQFGKYKTGRMSTLEDFAIAEWRPTDKELDGE